MALSLGATEQSAFLQPAQPLEPNTAYDLVVTNLAQDRGGLFLSRQFSARLTTNSDLDTTPPAITILPGAGATDVALNTSIVVVSDGPLASDSVTASNLQLLQNGQPLATDLSLANDWLHVLLRPVLPLAANTTYTVRVSGLKDITGNMMAGDETSTFTTGVGVDLAGPTFVSSLPASGATEVSRNPVIQLQFDEAIRPPEGGLRT